MTLELELSAKYEQMLADAEEVDETVRTRLEMELESAAMRHITEIHQQLEQAKQEAGGFEMLDPFDT